jgi:hypothetical protein
LQLLLHRATSPRSVDNIQPWPPCSTRQRDAVRYLEQESTLLPLRSVSAMAGCETMSAGLRGEKHEVLQLSPEGPLRNGREQRVQFVGDGGQ